MEEENLVCRLWLPNDTERYDNNITPHYHFKCTKCGNIHDVAAESQISEIYAKITNKYSFTITQQDLFFSGTCC